MKLKDLAANPGNPRKIDEEHLKMLKKSIDEYGDLSGFVFNETTRQLVGGHQRGKILPPEAEIVIEERYHIPTRAGTTAEGYVIVDGEKFSYRQVRWDTAKEKAANIAANKHGGEWDNQKLADWLIELDSMNIDMDLVGFTEEEIENICAPFRTMPKGLCDEDETPATPKTAKTTTGELWLLGDHRLLIGDCTMKENVERLMNGDKAMMWASDPPYGTSYVAVANEKDRAKAYAPIQNDELSDEELKDFIFRSIETVKPYMKNNFAFYMWHAMKMQACFSQAAAAAAGIIFHRQIIWVKPHFVFGRGQYHWRHELCLMGWLQGNEPPFYGERNQTTVWEIGRENDKIHPTQKPVAIWEAPILNHTKSGEVIYEPFAGSGSQYIACEKTGRKCYGFEIEPLYADVIIERWQKYTGNEAKREDGVRFLDLI